jgi:hypothetical protein
MQVIGDRLGNRPDVSLIACATPEVRSASLPAVENRFVLPLVIGPADGKRVLRPKSGTWTNARLLQ